MSLEYEKYDILDIIFTLLKHWLNYKKETNL